MCSSGTPRCFITSTACTAEWPVATIGSHRMKVRSSRSGSRTRYSTGRCCSSRYTPICPTRADGISSSSPSLMPTPARSTGTTASLRPAMTGASIGPIGVSMWRVVSGRLRVIS